MIRSLCYPLGQFTHLYNIWTDVDGFIVILCVIGAVIVLHRAHDRDAMFWCVLFGQQIYDGKTASFEEL